MFSGLNYITYEGGTGETAVIFDPNIPHARMAEVMDSQNGGVVILGAGKVSAVAANGLIHCYGEAKSLNITSRGIDDESVIKNLKF